MSLIFLILVWYNGELGTFPEREVWVANEREKFNQNIHFNG